MQVLQWAVIANHPVTSQCLSFAGGNKSVSGYLVGETRVIVQVVVLFPKRKQTSF